MILGNNVDCGVARKGTGIVDCIQQLGKPVGFWDLPVNFSLDRNTDTLDRARVLDEVKKGNFYVFNDAVDFTENNEDDVTQTFSSGIIADVRDGLPAFEFTFIKGYGWHTLAYSHNGFGGAVALLFENGVVGFALNADGNTITGLRRGRLKTKTFNNNTGSEVSKTMIGLQLIDPIQYNTSMFLINDTSFGSSPLDINGAIHTEVRVVGTPAVGDTTTVVEVVVGINTAVGVAGLTDASFNYTGQSVTAAVYDATTSQYTLTHDALTAGSKTVSLGTPTEVAAQIGTTEVLYSGSSNSFTV